MQAISNRPGSLPRMKYGSADMESQCKKLPARHESPPCSIGVSSVAKVVISFGAFLAGSATILAADAPAKYDVIIRRGALYDGGGGKPFVGDLAIREDKIAAIGDLGKANAALEIDAQGMAVAPGFINMLSWATESLLEDGRSQSDIRQGVTLEVFGEGWSMGPLNEAMRTDMIKSQGDIKFDVPWTTLAGFLEHLEKRGVSTNIASFVGATTARIHVLGYEDRR